MSDFLGRRADLVVLSAQEAIQGCTGNTLQEAGGGQKGDRVAGRLGKRGGAPSGEGGTPQDGRGAVFTIPPATSGQYTWQRGSARWGFDT